MTEQEKTALARFLGGKSVAQSFGVDDLQGLLLQISFAIMMVFMIAFFMFRAKSAHEQQEQVLELNRQKLVLAADNVEAAYRARYGLTVLMPGRAFDPADVISDGRLTTAPAARAAFADGALSASVDYQDPAALRLAWRGKILAAAGVATNALAAADLDWLDARVITGSDALHADVRGLQRSCAACIQRAWLKTPSQIDDPSLARLVADLKGADEARRLALAAEIADSLRARSLARLAELSGSPMLP